MSVSTTWDPSRIRPRKIPESSTVHRWTPCNNNTCCKCHKYLPLIEAGTNTPIIPCSYLRWIYLLYHPRTPPTNSNNNNNNNNNATTSNTDEEPLHFFLAATSLDIGTVKYTTLSDPIGNILNTRDLRWQILQMFAATYTKPFMTEEPKLNTWRKKIIKLHPTAISYPKAELAVSTIDIGLANKP